MAETPDPDTNSQIPHPETPFEIPECLRQDAAMPGDVILLTTHPDHDDETVEIWCHSVLIYHNCPYFKGVFDGGWSEVKQGRSNATRRSTPSSETDANSSKLRARKRARTTRSTSSKTDEDPLRPPVRATIDLTHQTADTVCDMLSFLYPNLELELNAENVGPLVVLADMLAYEDLKEECEEYLKKMLTSAPVEVLKAARKGHCFNLFGESTETIIYKKDADILRKLDELSLPAAFALLESRLTLTEDLLRITAIIARRFAGISCLNCQQRSGREWLRDNWRHEYARLLTPTLEKASIEKMAKSWYPPECCKCLRDALNKMQKKMEAVPELLRDIKEIEVESESEGEAEAEGDAG
ncbi:unnamed protein product [Sympodiomycopsis kandeliae]